MVLQHLFFISSVSFSVQLVNMSSPPMSIMDSNSTLCSSVSYAFVFIRVVLTVPSSIFILCLGLQQWRQQSSFKTMSHTDVSTFHFAALQLLWPLGMTLLIYGSASHVPYVLNVGSKFIFAVFYGEGLLHLLTCLDRYLAVVHPISYLGLRNVRWVRVRNISIGCVWLLCFMLSSVTQTDYLQDSIPLYGFLTFLIAIISFFSLSILFVLIRPGPGDRGGDGAQVDQSKQRAFCTVMAILGMLCFWFLVLLVCLVYATVKPHSNTMRCWLRLIPLWFNLPSTLILPLLYLHRSGKLGWCRHNRE